MITRSAPDKRGLRLPPRGLLRDRKRFQEDIAKAVEILEKML